MSTAEQQRRHHGVRMTLKEGVDDVLVGAARALPIGRLLRSRRPAPVDSGRPKTHPAPVTPDAPSREPNP